MMKPQFRRLVVPLLVTLLVGLVPIGCSSPEDSPADGHSSPPLEVEFGGCAASVPAASDPSTADDLDPICRLDGDTRLIVWAATSSDNLALELDGEPLRWTDAQTIAGGVRFEVELPATARELVLRSRMMNLGSSWRLRFTPLDRSAWESTVLAAIAEQDWAAATEAAQPVAEDSDHSESGLASAYLGQLALVRGDIAEAEQRLEAARPWLREFSDTQTEVEFSAVLLYSYIANSSRFAAARELIEQLPPAEGASLETQYNQAYFDGMLASETGDARTALASLQRSAQLADRLGNPRQRLMNEQMLALQMLLLGRRQEAAATLDQLLSEVGVDGDGCQRVELLNNAGWAALVSHEAGEPTASPLARLEEALELLRRQCPNDQTEEVTLRLNIALAQLNEGQTADARATLDGVSEIASEPGLRIRLWRRELEARLASASGDTEEALAAYRQLAEMATAAWSPEAAWRANVGVARTLQAGGDLDGALAAFATSERQLDEELLRVPLQEGREAFVALRDAATREYLELLIELERSDEALALARRSRSRISRRLYQSLRARALAPAQRREWYEFLSQYRAERAELEQAAAGDWEWPADRLAALRGERAARQSELSRQLDRVLADLDLDVDAALTPLVLTPGELFLLLHPLNDGWAVFVRSESGLTIATPDCAPAESQARRQASLRASPQSLATCLLSPFDEQLTAAERIRILASDELSNVDFQALALGDGVLLDVAEVLYDLDLGLDPGLDFGAVAPAPEGSAADSLLLVGDPNGDLPAARDEVAQIESRYAARDGVSVRALLGPQASLEELSEALQSSDLFHYAGHATFRGAGGWDSYIALANGEQLTFEDILALERVPRWVFLSGCETARVATGGESFESLGLAQLFLAAGAEAVIAAARPVDDQASAQIVDAFYEAWLGGSDLPASLRAAQLELRDVDPATDWSSYRLIQARGGP